MWDPSRQMPPLWLSALSITAGVAIAVGLVTGALVVPYYSGHFECARGSLLTSEYNWTPVLLVNSPYGGASNASLSAAGQLSGARAQNGSATAVFGMGEWFVYSVNRDWAVGPGSSPACQSYEVEHTPSIPAWQQSGGCAGCLVFGAGNQSDTSESTQFNLSVWGGPGSSGATSIIFHNGFYSGNAPNVSTCGGPAKTLETRSSWLDLQVPFVSNGDHLTFNVTIPTIFGYSAYTANFSYVFPGNFGTWAVDNLSGPGGPGGGWAFDYLGPCR